MTLRDWMQRTADALRALGQAYFPTGKRRRSWRHKAWDLRCCGQMAQILRCKACGDLMKKSAAILVGCGLRICPFCARRKATLLRLRLGRYVEKGLPKGMALFLLTFTGRYDPASDDDLSVEGIRRRAAVILAGWRHVWRRYLKPRGLAAVCSIEVSPRGAVHAHVLFLGRRPDIGIVRELWLDKVPDSPMVNVKYVRSPKSAIAEVVKYVTKGASPARPAVLCGAEGEFLDPELAARVEVAFSGRRLVECYGAWRGADADRDEPEDYKGAACTKCGVVGEWEWVSIPTSELAAQFGAAFKPRFLRCAARPDTS